MNSCLSNYTEGIHLSIWLRFISVVILKLPKHINSGRIRIRHVVLCARSYVLLVEKSLHIELMCTSAGLVMLVLLTALFVCLV